LTEVVSYLDQYLRTREIPDEAGAVNGLEVENRSGLVGRLVAAVDASQATIDGARGPGPGMLVVHHGLLWDGNIPVTGRRFRRLAALLDHDIALYAAHIPLDVHPEVGNNVLLARSLGIGELGWFDDYKGVPLGVRGDLESGVSRSELVSRLEGLLRSPARLIAGGPELCRTIGVITGAGGSRIGSAKAAGVDTFITGEGAHHTYFDAMEHGLNVIYAGHYATEQLGVKALAAHLSARFGLPWEYHHYPTGL
jgi:dinuclear metal center YbgI/SA1388 family protein